MYYTVKAHHITVRSYTSAEGVDELRQTLGEILPEGAVIQESVIEPEEEGGIFTHEMTELKSTLKKQRGIKELTEKIVGSLDDYDRGRLLASLHSHIDDDCNLYIRLSKNEAAQGNIVLEEKDSIHVTIKIAAYPAKKEKAVEEARELIQG
jgi:RNA binding exosome subunit